MEQKMTGLSVISYLYDKITNNQELTSVLGDRIFPLVAEEGTEYPYLIMKLESILPAYSKDGRVYDNITVSTSVYAKDYKTVAEIQETVRSLEKFVRLLSDSDAICAVGNEYKLNEAEGLFKTIESI